MDLRPIPCHNQYVPGWSTSRILKKTLLIQYLAENFDKRLLYFTSVYLTSKKYIDFITLLPEPIVIKIISNIDPGIGLASGLTSGQKYQFPANFRFRVFFSHADSDVKIHWNELEKFQKLGNSIHYRIKFGNKMLKKQTFHWSFILGVIVRPHQERSSQFSLVQTYVTYFWLANRRALKVIGSVSEPNWTEIYKINSILYKGWKSG